MKKEFLENLFKDLEMEDNTKKSIIKSILDENGNDINNEKLKTEGVKNDLKVKNALIEDLNEKIKKAEGVDIEAKDFDLVFSKLDKEKIKYEKNNKGEYVVSGVDEQIKDVKEKYPFLFEESNDDTDSGINLGGEHKQKTNDDDLKELEDAMGITEEAKK